MGHAMTKAERLREIERLYIQKPFSDSELAERLGVERSTIFRDRQELSRELPIDEYEPGRYYIDRTRYLSGIKVNLHEALALYLAARRASRQTRIAQPHVASALEKLAIALKQPMTTRLVRAAGQVLQQDAYPERVKTLEEVTRAWAEHRKLEISYLALHSEQVRHHLVHPYLIEPSLWSDGAYLVGHNETYNDLYTFKIERIESAYARLERFELPPDFDDEQILQHAWGIWMRDHAPVNVRLRFFPGEAARRLKESIWHRTQQIIDLPDGGCEWSAQVSEWQEMLPWVRGWGADVEVLEPPELRRRMEREVEELRLVYKLQKNNQNSNVFIPWAKFSKSNPYEYHALIYHMLDAAAVSQILWNNCLSESFKSSISSSFGLSVLEMGKTISFWVGLHDIGKAGPEFQKKNISHIKRLEHAGYSFPRTQFKVEGFHATATAIILRRIFADNSTIPRKFRNGLAAVLGGHHGEFPNDSQLTNPTIKNIHVGDDQWMELQNEIFNRFEETLNPNCPANFPDNIKLLNPLLLLITGLTTTSDWIASNENFFEFCSSEQDTEQYFRTSKEKAKQALNSLGFFGWRAKNETLAFTDLFQNFSPNTMQDAVIQQASILHPPFLFILEASTGSGKTEAALYLADQIIQKEYKSGIYIAMPTQATSNQMYSRFRDFLSNRYPEDQINLHLVHGAAFLSDFQENYQPNNIWSDEQQQDANIHSHSWFLPRKRTLLAPFGVGTVDQTFLSVLRTRFFFLRLFGLSHKVLIFDEVHAYDVYMTEIFKTLLSWLKMIGTSVIILTATLPDEARKTLLHAFSENYIDHEPVAFPRLSIADCQGSKVINAGQVDSRDIHINWINRNTDVLIETINENIKLGGCIAVICNTVKRSQDIFLTLEKTYQNDNIELILFHSRFPHLWRQDIENKVLKFFGKERKNRPQKAIVVATQVIEQSLDLDFDLIITDLAPIDLLIQRVGRLHRHENIYPQSTRPKQLRTRKLIIAAPVFDNDIPDYGADQFVYDAYILAKTQLALKNKQSVTLPKESDSLINYVYGDDFEDINIQKFATNLELLRQKMFQKNEISKVNSTNYLIPGFEQSFIGNLNTFFQDNPEAVSSHSLAAPTREMDPTIQIVCLHKDINGLHILGDEDIIDLEKPLSQAQINQCLKATIGINNRQVLSYLLQKNIEIPKSFRASAKLRWHYPIIFESNKFETNEFLLQLNPKIGLVITKQH